VHRSVPAPTGARPAAPFDARAAFVPTATTSTIPPPRRRHRRRRRAIRVYSVILLAAMLMAIVFSWLLRHLG